MKKLGVDQILAVTPEQIQAGFVGKVKVLLSDGSSVIMNEKEIFLNRYIWQLAIDHTNGYVSKDMTLTAHYNADTLTPDSFNDAMSAIAKEKINILVRQGIFNKDSMIGFADDVIATVDHLHNKVSYDNMRYVTVLDTLDFLNVQLDKNIVDSLIEVKKNPCEGTVEKCYGEIDSYMMRNRKSGMAIMYYSKALKPPQIKTLFGPIGGARDIDGLGYKDVITNSYFLGLNKASWFFAKSRDTAKAAIQSKEAIQDSDTLARSIQIISSVLSSIDFHDCGSTEYRKKYVTKDNLKNLEGKIYLNEETGKLENITLGHTHLIDTVVKLRSGSHCKLKEKHAVCLTCFGTLGLNLGPHVNIGHLAITILTAIVTQLHLAQKHHIAAAFEKILEMLSIELDKYFTINTKDSGLKLRDIRNKDYKTYLIIPEETVSVLTDDPEVMAGVDERSSSIIRTLELRTEVSNSEGNVATRSSDTIIVVEDGKTGYFSNEFLSYAVKNVEYVKKTFKVSLEDWDHEKNLMYILDKEYNYMELINELDNMTMNVRSKKNGNIVLTLDDYVNKLVKIINDKMSINEAWIEAFAYPFQRMIDSGLMSRDPKDPTVIDGRNVLNWRSFAAASAHDNFVAKVTNPLLFGMKPVNHPADPLFRADQFELNIGHRPELNV